MATPATVSLSPPDKLDFSLPDDWPQWMKHFERYRVASGLAEREGAIQVSALVYTMGTEAEDVLASFALSDDDSNEYELVTERF